MIPRFDIDVFVEVDPDHVMILTRDEWQDGTWTANADYGCIGYTEWADSSAILAMEGHLLTARRPGSER